MDELSSALKCGMLKDFLPVDRRPSNVTSIIATYPGGALGIHTRSEESPNQLAAVTSWWGNCPPSRRRYKVETVCLPRAVDVSDRQTNETILLQSSMGLPASSVLCLSLRRVLSDCCAGANPLQSKTDDPAGAVVGLLRPDSVHSRWSDDHEVTRKATSGQVLHNCAPVESELRDSQLPSLRQSSDRGRRSVRAAPPSSLRKNHPRGGLRQPKPVDLAEVTCSKEPTQLTIIARDNSCDDCHLISETPWKLDVLFGCG
ncbi:hypothetical protein J6590_002085 [Homalodisca vitripennis]|nr:hypothetical protein J6590_002085 [Homalodisca vitripennis]